MARKMTHTVGEGEEKYPTTSSIISSRKQDVSTILYAHLLTTKSINVAV